MMFPLVLDLAADRTDIHHDDPEFGYRFISDELPARGITAGRNRVSRLCSSSGSTPRTRRNAADGTDR
jgi:HTH-like domain